VHQAGSVVEEGATTPPPHDRTDGWYVAASHKGCEFYRRYFFSKLRANGDSIYEHLIYKQVGTSHIKRYKIEVMTFTDQ